jgi:Fe-S cluster assembly protein SufD
MTPVAEQTTPWIEQFRRADCAPFLELRAAAFRRFTELGFPSTHDEEWRFTNVAPIARTRFISPAFLNLQEPQAEHDVLRVSFFNGKLAGFPAALPKGVEFGRLAANADQAALYLGKYAPWDANPFTALNTAFAADGVFLRIASGTVVEQPIEIVFAAAAFSEPVVVHPRVLILVGAQAQCTIVEEYKGAGNNPYFTNSVVEVVTGENSVVDHYKIQREHGEAFHVSSLQAAVGRGANFSTHSISLGGALARNDVGATLDVGSHATLNGLYIVNGTQHVDHHTVIDHARPNATSHELYKGILDGRASAVFNGRIIVRKDAQKTDSKQTNKNLVLSDEAVIDTKPELQIHADDVRCTHGATIGQIDPEALFYLRSRGIGRKEARSLLTYAFAQDIIDRIKVPSLAESLERILFEKFYEHA